MAHLIDKDALVAEIERRFRNVNLNYVNAGSHPSALDINKKLQEGISKNLQSILSFINTLEVKEVDLEKEPTSEELEKASEEYAYTNWESDDYHEGASEGKPFDAIGHTQKCFIDGAQWGREQMIKDAVEGRMELNHIVVSYAELAKSFPTGKDGDKVKVIIIKEI